MEQEICTCKHSRDMHDSIVSKFNNGDQPKRREKDGKCKTTNCSCEAYKTT